MTSPGFVRLAIILGLLCLIGPFSIDMYLPAFPAIVADLGVSDKTAQITLMSYFLSFGVCQMIYGPAADMYGRRPPMFVGLGIFIVASIGCALAPNVETLIAFRALQGAGAAAVMVIPRAIIRDLYTGTAATRLMSLIMLVISVSPMLAPLAGSALIIPFGWRSVFYAVIVASGLSLFLIKTQLPETLPPEKRMRIAIGPMLEGYGTLMKDWIFLGLTAIGGFGMSSFFAFLSGASFVYQEHYGMNSTQFSLAFAFNAFGFFAMSQLAGRIGERYGLIRMVTVSTAGYSAVMILLTLLVVIGIDSLPVVMGLLFVSFAFLGLVLPTSMVLALETKAELAGSASALGGTLQMLLGVASMAAVAIFFDGTIRPMVVGMGVCAALAMLAALLTLPKVAEPAHNLEETGPAPAA
ncbi:multidrug effflux MFS transporter [Parvularcula marina]|uniref:Bcr/CflA family efflux transporter n=1 Tax=Parvularcula marina TaxID=2292771 RepID=A0A371RL32_9PROT|nr:multidrug effflux MFS transporter [Parvularcula marina]RFB06165.1 MFS transporter [Parvularcula marina]